MAESVIIEFGVDDKGTPVLKNITDSLRGVEGEAGKTGGSLKSMGDSSKGAGAAAGGMNVAMVGATAAIAGVAVAAASAAAALVGLVKFGQASVEAFREQDEVNRQIERSLRRAGHAGDGLAATLEQVDGAVSQLAVETNFGDEELTSMAATFVNLSGAATATYEDLELISDIAAATGQSGDAAAKLYANALEGQLRPSLARTTSLTVEQIEAINATEDATERAALAQEALAQAYGGTAKDINPLYRSMKNLEDAQGDVMQMAGSVIAEMGLFEPVLDLVTDGFRFLETYIDENKEAFQEWILGGVIVAAEAIEGFIKRLQGLSPVFALAVEYVQQLGRNFSIFVSSINIVIRSVVAFQKAIQAGIVRSIGAVLDAAVNLARFFGRDVPSSIVKAQNAINDLGDSIEEDMVNHLDNAGASVENITEKFNASRGAMDRIVERSANISAGLGFAGNLAGQLTDKFKENRDAIGQVKSEADSATESIRGMTPQEDQAASAEDDAEARKQAERQREIDHRNKVAQMRLAELRTEDDYLKVVMQSERERLELQAQDLTEAEKRLALYEIEERMIRSLADLDKDAHEQKMAQIEAENMARAEAIESERNARIETLNANQALLGQLDSQIDGLGTLAASLGTIHEISLDNAEGYQAMGAALSGFASLGGGLADLITEDRKKTAGIEAAFNAAAAIGAFAGFAASGFTAVPLGIAAAQHGIAAAQFGIIAGGGGKSSGGRASSSASGSVGRSARDAQSLDRGASQDARPMVVNYNLNGTFLETSDSVARRLDQSVESSQRNRFIAGRGRMERG